MSDPSHSITDHTSWLDHAHDHAGEFYDHDHDHDCADTGPAATSFISLGIDIGSSSTQLAFSRVTRVGSGCAAETLYLSPISATPFGPEGEIDAVQLRRIVDAAFSGAGMTADSVETGVVILTGAAAERRNARAIAEELATSGELLCAAAGHHMEARLAALGSGVVQASRGGQQILMLDVGGATTKLALVADGRILHTAAVAVGGRLAVIDRDNSIVRLEPAGERMAQQAGLSWRLGRTIDPAERAIVAEAMADAILATVQGSGVACLPAITAPLICNGPLDGVMFAGGVGEYVYGRESRDFGDLGRALGKALRRRIGEGLFTAPLLQSGECIRATVLGAAEHSLQLSGDTIYVSSHRELLPRRSMPVIRPSLDLRRDIDPSDVAASLLAHLVAFDLAQCPTAPLALAIPWLGSPSYERLAGLADGIIKGFAARIAARSPLYILLDGDLAQSLGRLLKEERQIKCGVMVIDRIAAQDFDFIDLGRIRLPSHVIPVTIRSLVFGG